MNRVIGFGVGLVLFLVIVFVLVVLAGVVSAALEIARERRAGLEPTRPGWEARDKLRGRRDWYALHMGESGGRSLSVRLWFRSLRFGPQCWCGFGPLLPYEAEGSGSFRRAGLGCVAVENDHPLALMCHESVGPYDRSPVLSRSGRVR